MVKTTQPSTPMVIVAAISLEKGAEMEKLVTSARTMVGVFERLRCRIVDNKWVEAEEFKVTEHLNEITVTPPETLTSVLGMFASEMLPEDRPLWHMTLIRDILADRDILVFRSHHAIGDGLSLVQMMNWIFDIENKDHIDSYVDSGDIESGLMSSDNNRSKVHPFNQNDRRPSLNSVVSDGGKTESSDMDKKTENNTVDTGDVVSLSVKSGAEENLVSGATRELRNSFNDSKAVNALISNVAQSATQSQNANSDGGSAAPPSKTFEVDSSGQFLKDNPKKKKKKKKKMNICMLVIRIIYLLILSPIRLLAILLMPSDPPNMLKCKKGQKVSINKCVAMSEPIDLDRIKHVGKAINGTVNDVVVATTALAVRNFMLDTYDGDESKLPSYIRCILPISLRQPVAKNIELDNRISAVFLTLPLREQNPKKMLTSIKRQMDRLKSFPDAFIVYALIALLVNWIPSRLFIKVQTWFYGKNTILLSNVPGRKSDGHFAGSKVTDMCFWVPLIGNGAVGLSIYSYIDHVVFSCLSDPEVLDNPSAICSEYVKAFDQLELMVLGRNSPNLTPVQVQEKTQATLNVTIAEEKMTRENKIIEQSVDIARGVAQAKAAKRLSKAKMARQASTIAAVKGQVKNPSQGGELQVEPMAENEDNMK
ncbi:hypothetical protein TrLO_g2635 [Triparma laevis f. longispina]|uniref:Diacylglycerol O-acyltransferase n=1 Tax=Triparma laevis f. longispina TaxID=1714387 RepID=A0A9W7FHB7_9STRA|nr:hypothetical protein TrLO_g2635 [Triparma laevis f. longispina]